MRVKFFTIDIAHKIIGLLFYIGFLIYLAVIGGCAFYDEPYIIQLCSVAKYNSIFDFTLYFGPILIFLAILFLFTRQKKGA